MKLTERQRAAIDKAYDRGVRARRKFIRISVRLAPVYAVASFLLVVAGARNLEAAIPVPAWMYATYVGLFLIIGLTLVLWYNDRKEQKRLKRRH